MDAEIARLHQSIDSLAGAVSGLHHDVGRQAEKLDQISARQTSDFRDLLTKIHDNYKELVGLQRDAFKDFGDRQRDAFKDFGDRLDKLLAKQDEQVAAIRGEMRTDFSRVVDRQDSHFRWLFGLILAYAVTVALALYKMH